MHDLKYIRENPEAFDAALRRRGARAASAEVMAQDTKKRAIQTELQNMLARRNEASKASGFSRIYFRSCMVAGYAEAFGVSQRKRAPYSATDTLCSCEAEALEA